MIVWQQHQDTYTKYHKKQNFQHLFKWYGWFYSNEHSMVSDLCDHQGWQKLRGTTNAVIYHHDQMGQYYLIQAGGAKANNFHIPLKEHVASLIFTKHSCQLTTILAGHRPYKWVWLCYSNDEIVDFAILPRDCLVQPCEEYMQITMDQLQQELSNFLMIDEYKSTEDYLPFADSFLNTKMALL